MTAPIIYEPQLSSPLGINCRGSYHCSTRSSVFHDSTISVLIQLLRGIPSYSIYGPGDHIVCIPGDRLTGGGYCAFTQGPHVLSGINAGFVLEKLGQLRDHDCTICGSVPLEKGNNPDVAGILTVNFVAGGVCKGVCPPTYVPPVGSAGRNRKKGPGSRRGVGLG